MKEKSEMRKVGENAMVNYLYDVFNNYGVKQFLGGSKRFIDLNNNSDWDFFIFIEREKEEEFYNHLGSIGFTYNFGTGYEANTKQYIYGNLFHITCFNIHSLWYSLNEEHQQIATFIKKMGKDKTQDFHNYIKELGLKGKEFYRILRFFVVH